MNKQKIREYVVLEILGRGSHSAVYKCYNTRTKRLCAVKEIQVDSFNGVPVVFVTENCILNSLKHKNIVRFHDIAEDSNGIIYIELEYLSGRDLGFFLNSIGNKIERLSVKKIIFQLLEGLSFLHKENVIHRDLKLENLFIDHYGVLKIGDFGVSAFVSNFGTKIPLLAEVGTLEYRPPEILMGSNFYDEKMDIWSVGCILAELYSDDSGPFFTTGRDYHIREHLETIFELAGAPTKESWPELFDNPRIMNNFRRLLTSRRFTKEPRFDNEFQNNGTDVIDLLEKLLVVNPKHRISAEEALQHVFFDDIRKEMEEYPEKIRNGGDTFLSAELERTNDPILRKIWDNFEKFKNPPMSSPLPSDEFLLFKDDDVGKEEMSEEAKEDAIEFREGELERIFGDPYSLNNLFFFEKQQNNDMEKLIYPKELRASKGVNLDSADHISWFEKLENKFQKHMYKERVKMVMRTNCESYSKIKNVRKKLERPSADNLDEFVLFNKLCGKFRLYKHFREANVGVGQFFIPKGMKKKELVRYLIKDFRQFEEIFDRYKIYRDDIVCFATLSSAWGKMNAKDQLLLRNMFREGQLRRRRSEKDKDPQEEFIGGMGVLFEGPAQKSNAEKRTVSKYEMYLIQITFWQLMNTYFLEGWDDDSESDEDDDVDEWSLDQETRETERFKVLVTWKNKKKEEFDEVTRLISMTARAREGIQE